VRDRLGEIAAPTLVIVGEHDRETPLSYAEALANGIPGAVLRIAPGAGHIANVEAPEAVNAALRAHLDAVEAAR
jgi:3-oxoadipate enol-lactonase